MAVTEVPAVAGAGRRPSAGPTGARPRPPDPGPGVAQGPSRSRLLLLIAGVTIAGGTLRFATLSQGVWFDEAVTVRDVSGSFPHLLSSVAHHELSPPLYFVALWLWRAMFGGSTFALRAMSAVAGTLVIPVAFATAARLVGRRIAVIVGLLAACSPVMLYYSQELRPYALLVLLCSLGLLTFVRLLQAPSPRGLVMWAALSTLALACHYFAVLAVLPQAAVLMVGAWRGHGHKRSTALAVGTFGSALAACGLLLRYQYARSYHFVLAQISSPFVSERFDAHTAASGNGHQLAQELFIGPGGPWKALTALAMLGAALLALVNIYRHEHDDHRRGAEFALLLFLPAVAAALLFQVLALPYQGRYLLVLWLPLTIVIASGLGMVRTALLRMATTSMFCALSLVIGITTATVPRFSGREDTRSPARSLGVASVPRLIGIDQQWDLLAFRLSRPQAGVYTGRSATIRELDLVAMPARGFPAGSDANPPPAPVISGLPRQLSLRNVIHGPTYVIERFTASAPVTVTLIPSEHRLTAAWRFLYEPAGAGAGGP